EPPPTGRDGAGPRLLRLGGPLGLDATRPQCGTPRRAHCTSRRGREALRHRPEERLTTECLLERAVVRTPASGVSPPVRDCHRRAHAAPRATVLLSPARACCRCVLETASR